MRIHHNPQNLSYAPTVEIVTGDGDIVLGYQQNYDLAAFEARWYGNAGSPSCARTAGDVGFVLRELVRQESIA